MEQAIGCNDHTKLSSYKQKFETHKLAAHELQSFRQALTDDAIDTYFKGAISLLEAITSINKGYQSWAIVKLYYSTFYFLRTFFASRDLGIVKCSSSIYTLSISAGASVVRRTGVKHRNQDVRGDHKTTFYIFEKDFGQSELILSNTIDGLTVFEWMMAAREDVNYRHPTFSEPQMDLFQPSMTDPAQMIQWLKLYIEDQSGLYAFQEDHCCIATPLYLMAKLKTELNSRLGIQHAFSSDQQEAFANVLKGTELTGSPQLNGLFFG